VEHKATIHLDFDDSLADRRRAKTREGPPLDLGNVRRPAWTGDVKIASRIHFHSVFVAKILTETLPNWGILEMPLDKRRHFI